MSRNAGSTNTFHDNLIFFLLNFFSLQSNKNEIYNLFIYLLFPFFFFWTFDLHRQLQQKFSNQSQIYRLQGTVTFTQHRKPQSQEPWKLHWIPIPQATPQMLRTKSNPLNNLGPISTESLWNENQGQSKHATYKILFLYSQLSTICTTSNPLNILGFGPHLYPIDAWWKSRS